jgi:hypothetical protein
MKMNTTMTAPHQSTAKSHRLALSTNAYHEARRAGAWPAGVGVYHPPLRYNSAGGVDVSPDFVTKLMPRSRARQLVKVVERATWPEAARVQEAPADVDREGM